MISKVIQGNSFDGICKYLCSDQGRAKVLDCSGVRGYDYKLMSKDFNEQKGLNPSLKRPVLHMILSYYPGEQIKDWEMIYIAREYMKELSIKDTQYAIVKHSDRDHPHTHIIINRIDSNGKTIKDNWIGLKGKKVAQKLTIKHHLRVSESKNLNFTHLERLNEFEAKKYEIYQAILESLPRSHNIQDLENHLKKYKIEVLYKYKGQTKELQGISFKSGEYKFKGSEVDRRFSLKNLEKIVAQVFLKHTSSIQSFPSNQLEQNQSKDGSLVLELLKPINNNYPLNHPPKRKKRKIRRGL